MGVRYMIEITLVYKMLFYTRVMLQLLMLNKCQKNKKNPLPYANFKLFVQNHVYYCLDYKRFSCSLCSSYLASFLNEFEYIKSAIISCALP